MKVIIEQSMLHLRINSNWEYHHFDQSSPLASMNRRITLWERWILRVLFSDEGAKRYFPLSDISFPKWEIFYNVHQVSPFSISATSFPNHHHLE